jgi:hypothetical protein
MCINPAEWYYRWNIAGLWGRSYYCDVCKVAVDKVAREHKLTPYEWVHV